MKSKKIVLFFFFLFQTPVYADRYIGRQITRSRLVKSHLEMNIKRQACLYSRGKK